MLCNSSSDAAGLLVTAHRATVSLLVDRADLIDASDPVRYEYPCVASVVGQQVAPRHPVAPIKCDYSNFENSLLAHASIVPPTCVDAMERILTPRRRPPGIGDLVAGAFMNILTYDESVTHRWRKPELNVLCVPHGPSAQRFTETEPAIFAQACD